VDALAQVPGMTPSIFAAARPYLTVYTDTKRPDPRYAPPVVRKALELVPEEGGDEAASNTAGPTPAPGTVDANGNAVPPQQSAAPTVIVEVQVTAYGNDGGVYVRDAVVRLDPDESRGYVVLDWRRGDLPP
jgi:general secretion pathway protein K